MVEAEKRKVMNRYRPEKIGLILRGGAILLLLAGCFAWAPERPATPPDDTAQAETAARAFFEALHDRDYEKAVELYGGSYDVLTSMNPDLDPADGPALFAQGCQFNGFTCLRMGEVLGAARSGEGEYTLMVQFLREDGEIFVLGPCCGADETEMPPLSEFPIRVIEDESGVYKVLDLPPYVP